MSETATAMKFAAVILISTFLLLLLGLAAVAGLKSPPSSLLSGQQQQRRRQLLLWSRKVLDSQQNEGNPLNRLYITTTTRKPGGLSRPKDQAPTPAPAVHIGLAEFCGKLQVRISVSYTHLTLPTTPYV